MRVLSHTVATRLFSGMAIGLPLVALCACSALRPTATPATAFYALDDTADSPGGQAMVVPLQVAPTLTLLINPPHAAAGFDSPHIVYLREPHRLDYYALSQWVDPPARMLGPLLVASGQKSAAFRAVVLMPGAGAGDLRLDTDLIRLQHEFETTPSQVRLSLRATLVDDKTRRVLAWQEFEVTEPASSEDAYGGVHAANRAVQRVLDQLALFLAAKANAPKVATTTP